MAMCGTVRAASPTNTTRIAKAFAGACSMKFNATKPVPTAPSIGAEARSASWSHVMPARSIVRTI